MEQEEKKIIDVLVDKFLAWPLPESVCVDWSATQFDYKGRIGTNLLTATEAHQMIEFLFAELLTTAREQERERCAKERGEGIPEYVCVSEIRMASTDGGMEVYILVDGKEYRVIRESIPATLPINHNVTTDGMITAIRKEE